MLLISTVSLNAQYFGYPMYSNPNVINLNDLTESECIVALDKATDKISNGTAMTIIGGISAIIGYGVYVDQLSKIGGFDSHYRGAIAGAVVMGIGGIITSIGIPLWIYGKLQKDTIEIVMTKFKKNVSLKPSLFYDSKNKGFCASLTFSF